ncbi:uncharacterized protein [Prorops nasuta]|uniref:uncharacterized protein n=1 Tax=Prorops nasuta TaxID=863751 RepID=UPI0034CD3DFA
MRVRLPLLFPLLLFFLSISVSRSTPISENEKSHSESHHLLVDCKNPNYKIYIKCLTKHRRSLENHRDHENQTLKNRISRNINGTCMESCLSSCTNDLEDTCNKKCGNHCYYKKRRKQIITEYEEVCDDCEQPNQPRTNVSTKIDVHNINNNYNNGSFVTTGGSSSPLNPTVICIKPPCPPAQTIEFTINAQVRLGPGPGPGPGQAPCNPSVQPCWQGATNPVIPYDCSGCGFPGYSYKCDWSCYRVNQTQNPYCQPPSCIGGAMQLPMV